MLSMNAGPKEIVAILHNIRSIHNVGSMFRTADALGISALFLVGYTPAPLDKFKRPNKEITKVALGGEKSVEWEAVPEIEPLIKKLRSKNYSIVAVEQASHATDYKTFNPSGPTAFVFGNEVDGVPEDVLALCDAAVEIPMKGEKESLNVSVAFGIALARILDN